MPDESTDSAEKLSKLGERLRQGWANLHPTQEKELETVRGAVREQWEREQELNQPKPSEPDPATEPGRKPPDIDLER